MKRLKSLTILVLFFVVFLPFLGWGQTAYEDLKRTYIGQAVIGEGWKIVLDCINRDPVNGHGMSIIFRLFDSKGEPHTGEYLVTSEDSSFFPPFTLPVGYDIWNAMSPNSYRFISITRELPGLMMGWLEILQDNEATEHIVCSERIQLFVGGDFSMEAGVPALPPALNYVFTVFAAEEADQKTGIAIANVTQTAKNWVGEKVLVTFTLVKNGSLLNGLSRTRTIAPGGHLSVFWTELFPEYQNDRLWRERRTMAGVIKVTGKKVSDGSPASLVVTVLNTRITATGFSISPVVAAVVAEEK